MRATLKKAEEVHVFRHDSMASLVEKVMAIPAARIAAATECITDESFLGGRSFQTVGEATDAIHEDWQEGLDIIGRLRDELAEVEMPQPRIVRRTRRWSEDNGDSVDFDRLRSGQEYWATTTKAERTGPRNVQIHVGAGATQSYSGKEIFWRGAAAITLAEWLESAGYRVKIVGFNYSENLYFDEKGTFSAGLQITTLKDYQDPLNVSLLANSLSGWCYRSTWFGAKSLGKLNYNSTLGSTIKMQDRPQVEAEYFPNSLRCDGFYDAKEAKKWLQEMAAKFAADSLAAA
jgi:hypothetical protein